MAGWDIAALEMMNIFIALRLWKCFWVGKTIEVVVITWQCSRQVELKDKSLTTISRNIYNTLASKFDGHLKVSHVPGKINVIADIDDRCSRNSGYIFLIKAKDFRRAKRGDYGTPASHPRRVNHDR